MKSVEVSAPTREAAIQKGLDELGLEMYEVDRIEIIDEGSKGLFGFGARPVKVRLVVEHLQETAGEESPAERDRGPRDRGRRSGRRGRRGGAREQQAPRSEGAEAENSPVAESRSGKEAGKGSEARTDREVGRGGKPREGRRRGRRGGGQEGGEQRKEGGEQRKEGGEPRRDRDRGKAEGQQRRERGDARAERSERREERQRQVPLEEPVEAGDEALEVAEELVDAGAPPARDEEEMVVAITDEQGNEAAALLQTLIAKMGMESEVVFVRSEDGAARLDVSSEDSAILIGRKGRNLNAMQYLVNRIISQNDAAENTERLVVDVEGYVDRRCSTLQDMARSFARKVKETGRSMRLKPLSPQERRIIHLTLQSDPDVKTYSLGESLFRSVVVSPIDAEEERPRSERGRPSRRNHREQATDRGGDRERNNRGGQGAERVRSAPVAPAADVSNEPKTENSGVSARKRGYGRYTFDDDIDVGQFGD